MLRRQRAAHHDHPLDLFESARPARQAAAINAARSAAAKGEGEAARRRESQWQRDQLPEAIRELVLDDQAPRKRICWSVLTPEPPE
jgi:hypothetical protein